MSREFWVVFCYASGVQECFWYSIGSLTGCGGELIGVFNGVIVEFMGFFKGVLILFSLSSVEFKVF